MHRLAWFIMNVVVLTPALAQAADESAGKSVFSSNCSVCHSAREGANKIGPSLYGVVGRQAGSVQGYSYSAAMKKYGKVWDQTTLTVFLQNPRGTVAGTRMSFPGLHDDNRLQQIIPYLASLK